MSKQSSFVSGAGLGFRRDLLPDLEQHGVPAEAGFFEVAPENWMDIGGRFEKQFRRYAEQRPFTTHGLSLSLGSPAPLDEAFVLRIKRFLDQHRIRYYTEHLSYCSDDGHLYDLMPIPFTAEAVDYVAARIRRVQELLERRIAVENVSYYAAPGAQMDELSFVNAVVEAADCDLLLDVNNVYVNSINHRYDPRTFIDGVDPQRVRYLHVAGHYVEAEGVRVDTHGADVCADVWDLLDHTYARIGVLPTLLERDFNLPPLSDLRAELQQIRDLQARHQAVKVPAGA